MIQSRTHNCNELRIGNVGERVTLVGWFENMRKVTQTEPEVSSAAVFARLCDALSAGE